MYTRLLLITLAVPFLPLIQSAHADAFHQSTSLQLDTLENFYLKLAIKKMQQGKRKKLPSPHHLFKLAMQEEAIHGLAAIKYLIRYYKKHNPLSHKEKHKIISYALHHAPLNIIRYLFRHGCYDKIYLLGKAKNNTIFRRAFPSFSFRFKEELFTHPFFLKDIFNLIKEVIQIFLGVRFFINILFLIVYYFWPAPIKNWKENLSTPYKQVISFFFREPTKENFSSISRLSKLWVLLKLFIWEQINNLLFPFLLYSFRFLQLIYFADELSSHPSYLINLLLSKLRTAKDKTRITALLLKYGAPSDTQVMIVNPLSLPLGIPVYIVQQLSFCQYFTITPLSIAAKNDLLGVAKLLIKAGADPNGVILKGKDQFPTQPGTMPQYIPVSNLFYQEPHPFITYYTPLELARSGSRTHAYLKKIVTRKKGG